ncbi:hypothetical protein, partial [Enterococcus sp. 8E11_MSG4843]|uniref:hypothetical protein n=2 Tax=Enterococcus TaxID=1350 RepID=UPI001C3DFF3A
DLHCKERGNQMEELTYKTYRCGSLKFKSPIDQKRQKEIERKCNRQEVQKLAQILLKQEFLLIGN